MGGSWKKSPITISCNPPKWPGGFGDGDGGSKHQQSMKSNGVWFTIEDRGPLEHNTIGRSDLSHGDGRVIGIRRVRGNGKRLGCENSTGTEESHVILYIGDVFRS
eukprot:Gb_38363 [translate_table: standard]